jgi:ATP-dependent Lhr-like helicase
VSFELLSKPIKKFIYEKGWESLRPIQAAAISRILISDENFILASRTASGKTEAAFLPILSKLDFSKPGVQVLYISPLIALINDQFYRIEELCKNLDIPVTKWHGESNKTLKERLLKHPSGIVLITPESLEAMFVNKPFNVKQLFSNLKYVVVDEIHSFIGTDRGTQLKSLLSRLQNINSESFSIIGLSATIGDYDEAKKFTGNEEKTKVLLDRAAKDVNVSFRYFKNEDENLPQELINDLYRETKDSKTLVFPNSRGKVEEVAVRLKKLSKKLKGHENYFSHHSAVDREVREYVEFFAKNNRQQNFCISCTSTLELGIDIGTVDKIVQIDATHSIASLIQRLGRSGRKEGANSNLQLYATNPWSLLQSIACWLLYQEGFIEPPQKNERPYDILVHQALSITKGRSGIQLKDLITQLKTNAAFRQIEESEIKEILNYLIEIDFLEKLQQEVIIGIEGEKVVNSREFYSVFKTEENFKVVNAGNAIGEIPFSPQIKEGENILLSARIWKISFIDPKAKKIGVMPARDGKRPKFFGEGGVICHRIREKMLQILYSQDKYEFLDPISCEEIEILRREFSVFNIKNLHIERPLLLKEKQLELYTFFGTRVNRTVKLLLDIAGVENLLNEIDCRSEIYIGASNQDLISKWNILAKFLTNIDIHIANLLQTRPTLISFSKWGIYLPEKYKVKLLKDKYFDIDQASSILAITKLIENK